MLFGDEVAANADAVLCRMHLCASCVPLCYSCVPACVMCVRHVCASRV